MRPWVLSFFFLSGLSGLLYEVVWIRAAGTVIGNTTYAMGTVVGVYMAGLGLGAWRGGRAADRRTGAKLLRLYGILELGIAASALAAPFLIKASEPVYRALWETPLYPAFRVLLVAAVLIVPTTLMGATLPVLARFLSDTAQAAPHEAGRAYAINTLGGVAGTLAAGFWLIPSFGLTATTVAAAVLNVGIGLGALRLGRGKAGDLLPAPAPEPPPPKLALAVSSLSGLAALLYEVAWTRAIVLSVGSTVYAFTLILAAFIWGLAAGSGLASRFVRRDVEPLRSLAVIQAAAGILAVALLPLLGNLPLLFAPLVESYKDSYGGLLAFQFGLIIIFVFVPTLFIGAVFPFTCRIAARTDEGVGRSVAAVYGWNTIGCIAGSLVGSFLLLPAVGPSATVRVAALVNLGLAAFLAWRAWPRVRLAPAAPALAAAAVWLVPGWEVSVLASGPYMYGETYTAASRAARMDLKKFLEFESKVVASYWDAYGLVTIHQHPKGMKALRINGKADASDGPSDMLTQLHVGHLPLVHHPAPKRVLVIGLGGGVTLGAVARHPVERIDCVEISAAVVRAAEHFGDVTGNVLRDPRVRVVVGDGRNALLFGREAYDVIVSEPSNLWLSGMANLFTREFFVQASRRLAEGGIFCQWVHAYRLPVDDFRSVLRTFYAAFPHGSVWEISPGGDYLLLGTPAPLRPRVADLEDRLSRPEVRREIGDPAYPGAPGLLGHLVTDRSGALRVAGPGPVLTDDHCPIEYTSPKALYRNVISETIKGLDAVRGEPVERSLYDGADERVARRREAHRAFAALAGAAPTHTALVAMEKLRSLESLHGRDRQVRAYMDAVAQRVRANAQAAQASGDPQTAIHNLRAIPRAAQLYGEAQLDLAILYHAVGRPEEAKRCLADASADPQSFAGLAVRGAVHEDAGRIEEAVAVWREAIRLNPGSAAAYARLASCLQKLGRKDEARQAARRAVELDPGHLKAVRLLDDLSR